MKRLIWTFDDIRRSLPSTKEAHQFAIVQAVTFENPGGRAHRSGDGSWNSWCTMALNVSEKWLAIVTYILAASGSKLGLEL